MTRALITGITGMVGSHLAEFLLANTDWDVHGLYRWRSPLDNITALIDRANRGDRVTLHYGDLRDPHSMTACVTAAKPDFVFHLAAQSFPKTSFDAPLETYETNINGTTNLMEALRHHAPEAIVHVCSSSEVFGRVPRDQLPINEECGFHPASPYAISKVGAELVGRHYAEAYGMTTLTTRMFTHTGPRRGDVFAESSFAKQIAMIEAGLMEPVVRVGNLKSLRTIADVRDAVRAYYLLVTVDPVAGSVFNIGGTHVCEVGDVLQALIDMSTKRDSIDVQIDPARLRPIDADLQVPDTTKFTAHTGWQPELSFETTMSDLLAYWREAVATRGNAFLLR